MTSRVNRHRSDVSMPKAMVLGGASVDCLLLVVPSPWPKAALCALLAFASFLQTAFAQQPFRLERFEEEYSKAAMEAEVDRPMNRIKHIQLGETSYLSLGGEVRERVDSNDAPSFGIGAVHDTYAMQRLMLHADLHLGEQVRTFVQFGRHNVFRKSQKTPSDTDRTDVQNAFVDFAPQAGKPLVVRIGRQELLLNSAQRFLSVREGPNMRQSFDGLSVAWNDPELAVKAFYTRPVRYRVGSFDDSSDRSQRLLGATVTYVLTAASSIQVYALELDREQVKFGSIQADEVRKSIAARWAGKVGRADHDVEAIYQTGTFGRQDIRAWALSIGGGYTMAERWSPRLGLELDAGSGDRDPKDGRLGTFNPMFPKGPFFDPSSLHSWANLLLVRATVSVAPVESVLMSFSLGERWRQTARDAVYTQPYVPIAATLGNSERRVGEEYEFNLTWQADRYLTILVQALHVKAGPAIRLAGGRSANFAMVTAQLKF